MRGLARVVAARAAGGEIAVVCGKGNNGGDGFVAARHLLEDGHEVRVLLLAPGDDLSGDARTNYERLASAVLRAVQPPSGCAARARSSMRSSAPASPDRRAARRPRRSRRSTSPGLERPVIACDVPSGVDASTGEVAAEAVLAELTVTFHAGKPGLWIPPGKAHAGEVSVIDIGIPVRGGVVEPDIGLISRRVTAAVPRRGQGSTKFTAGAVLVCGGSPGLTGAPCMAAMAAMRAGAGYVTAAVPASLSSVFETKLLEVMVAPLR